MKRDYYVVLQNSGTKIAACFNSKTDFNKWYKECGNVDDIVAQGITVEEAIKMSDCIDDKSTFAELIKRSNKNE